MEKLKTFLYKNIKWFILLITLIIFIYIVQNVFTQETLKIDKIVYDTVISQYRTDMLTTIFTCITALGSAFVLVGICIFSFLFLKNKRVSICLCANLMISYLTNLFLKNIIQRERPNDFRLIDETGYSFPSGHSMVSMAFYGLIIYFIYKYVKNKYIKWSLCAMLTILIFLIGFSRIYLGVHYTSDVIAGFIASIGYLIIFTSMISLIKDFSKTKNINKDNI